LGIIQNAVYPYFLLDFLDFLVKIGYYLTVETNHNFSNINNMSKEEKKEQSKDWRSEILDKIKAGTTVKVHQKITEKNTKGEEKQRIQIFEGIVLSRKKGKEKGGTIIVRKIASGGIGVERIFPIYSPSITKIEVTKQAKVRQAKLYYLRDYNKKLKEKQV